MTDTNHPRITFILFSYNQGRWIGEAVAAALAQTFSPLEIIINDDASTDGSQKIINDMVSCYHGPHRVRVNLNSANLGLLPNLNRAFRMSSAPFVVVAAGDDISEPDRVATIAHAIESPGQQICAIVSDAIAIDENGKELGYIDNFASDASLSAAGLAKSGAYVNGAAAGYARELIELFGDIDPSAWGEDSVLPFRAALLGRIVHIRRPLIKRRLHSGSMTGGPDSKERLLRLMRPTVPCLSIRLNDIQHPEVRKRLGADTIASLRQSIIRSIEWHDCMLRLVEKRPGAFWALFHMVIRGRATLFESIKALLVLRFRGVWRAYLHISGYIRRSSRQDVSA